MKKSKARRKNYPRLGLLSFAYPSRPNHRVARPERRILVKAENDIRERIRENPEDVLSHYWLGTLLSAQGRHEEAEEEYRRVILLKKGLSFMNRVGSLIKAPLREKVRGQAWMSTFSETFGFGFPGNQYLRGTEESLRKTLASDPENDQAHLLLGKVLFHQGKFGASEMALREAVRLNPGNDMGHYYRGVVLLTQERFAEAEQEFRGIVQKHPHDPVALGILATVVGLQGKSSLALEIWARTLCAEDDPHAYRRIQAAMVENGLPDKESRLVKEAFNVR